MDVSGHQDDNPRWVAIEEAVVAKVNDGQISGLLIYGDVSAERLRSIKLKRLANITGTGGLAAADTGGTIPVPHPFPEWAQDNPPGPSEVIKRFSTLKPKGPGRLVPTGNWRPTSAQRARIIDASTKREGEGAADFYHRFAEMLQEIAPRTESPNQVISEVTELSADVVKQYVHRARKIGALPPARRRRT